MSVTLGSPQPIIKKETSESSGNSGVGTQSSLTPNQNLHSSDKSSPTMSSQQPTSPPQTSHTIAPQHSSVNETEDVSESKTDDINESKTSDDMGPKIKVQPTITDNLDSNVKTLVKDITTTGFHGPNCHSATLLAQGLEFTLMDNHIKLIDTYVENFTTDVTESYVSTKTLNEQPKDLKKGDIIVIKRDNDQRTEHSFTYLGDDTFFQKDNQSPGKFYTSDFKTAIGPWVQKEKNTYDLTFKIVRPKDDTMKSSDVRLAKPLALIKQTELKFGSMLETAWNSSKEFMAKHKELEKFSDSFFPTKDSVDCMWGVKQELNNLKVAIEQAKKGKETMEPTDIKRLEFVEQRYNAMVNQAKEMVQTMQAPFDTFKDTHPNDKKVWLKLNRNLQQAGSMF